MKISVNWLKEYLSFNYKVNELCEHLTMLGLEVDSHKKLGNDYNSSSVQSAQQQIENLIADRSIFNGGKSIYVEKSFRQLSLLKVTNFSQAEKKKMKEQTMRDPSLIEINQCSVLYGGTDYMKAVTYDQQEDDVVLVETFTEDQIIQQAYEKAKKNNLVIDLS